MTKNLYILSALLLSFDCLVLPVWRGREGAGARARASGVHGHCYMYNDPLNIIIPNTVLLSVAGGKNIYITSLSTLTLLPILKLLLIPTGTGSFPLFHRNISTQIFFFTDTAAFTSHRLQAHLLWQLGRFLIEARNSLFFCGETGKSGPEKMLFPFYESPRNISWAGKNVFL